MIIATLWSSTGRTEEAPTTYVVPTSSIKVSSLRDSITERAHAMVEIGIGGLSLPYKKFCLPTEYRCASSDYTLLGSLRYSLRWSPSFAVGAGISLGFRPLSDNADIQSSEGVIPRVHSRNYLLLSSTFRYYFFEQDGLEVWAGATGGLIVVSDRYELQNKGTAIINPRNTTLASQGPMIGLGLGLDWSLNSSWAIGGWTHQMIWFLPENAACGATYDCATVSGASYSLELGLSMIYRSRL